MSTFVLVPGACHGAWWYDALVDALSAAGQQARALTLAGLGPDGLAPGAIPTLTDHVEQVARAVEQHSQDADESVVLVGHSYAGSVITGAADQVPALVYLDAFVPRDGDSCWSMTNDEQRAWYTDGAGRTGVAVDPLPFFDPRARPHPLATLVQRITLSGAWQTVPTKTYALAQVWPPGTNSPFTPTADRLATDPDWTVHRWPTRHNVLHDGPQRVLNLLMPHAA